MGRRGKPTDTELLGTTWSKVNKDGSPDRRFKDNRQLNQYRYAELWIDDNGSFNVNYFFSKVSAAESAVAALQHVTDRPTAVPASTGGRKLTCPKCKASVTLPAGTKPVCSACGYGRQVVKA